MKRILLASSLVVSIVVFVVVFGVVFGVSQAGAEPHEERKPPRVIVTGEAELRAAPDQAFVLLAVESRDPNPRQAQQKNSTIVDAVLQKVGPLVGEKAIRTISYSLTEEFDYEKGRRIPRGFLAQNQVEVRVDDITKVGDVIGQGTEAGATSVSGLRFDVTKRDELEREALRQAVAEARSRAEAAASGAGARIGSLLEIEQQPHEQPPMPFYRRDMAMAAAEAAPAPPIEAGEIEIRATVRVTAALE